MEACHFPDRNPANNRLDNLRWGTRKENYDDSVKHGTAYLGLVSAKLRGEEHPATKLNEDLVQAAVLLRELGDFGAKSICEFLDLDTKMRGAINGILCGQSWNAVTGLPPYKPKSSKPGRPRRPKETS